MRIIKGNTPFSQLDKDYYWAPEDEQYLESPRFGIKIFKNQILKDIYDEKVEDIMAQIIQDSQGKNKSIAIMLDGYDCTVSHAKVVNFVLITGIFY